MDKRSISFSIGIVTDIDDDEPLDVTLSEAVWKEPGDDNLGNILYFF